MDKYGFINRIIALYPHAIKDHDAQYDTYNRALPISDKVDYEEVYNIFCAEHKDSFPPPPALIKEWASRCVKENYQPTDKWIHVKIYNPFLKTVVNTDCFPAGTSEQAILNTYKKRFGDGDWRIIYA